MNKSNLEKEKIGQPTNLIIYHEKSSIYGQFFYQ